MENIYLVGMMGAGKSEVGRRLAKRLDRHFFETDQFIREVSGLTIPDIFSRYGEQEFRRMESDVLADVACRDWAVISSGGGIVTSAVNISLMKSTGLMVYLRAKPETLWRRICNDKHRPLLQVENPFERIQELLKQRAAQYEQADVMVDTDQKSPDAVAEELEHLLEKFPRKK